MCYHLLSYLILTVINIKCRFSYCMLVKARLENLKKVLIQALLKKSLWVLSVLKAMSSFRFHFICRPLVKFVRNPSGICLNLLLHWNVEVSSLIFIYYCHIAFWNKYVFFFFFFFVSLITNSNILLKHFTFLTWSINFIEILEVHLLYECVHGVI